MSVKSLIDPLTIHQEDFPDGSYRLIAVRQGKVVAIHVYLPRKSTFARRQLNRDGTYSNFLMWVKDGEVKSIEHPLNHFTKDVQDKLAKGINLEELMQEVESL